MFTTFFIYGLEIAAIKIAAPRMAKAVIDRAMQAHGG